MPGFFMHVGVGMQCPHQIPATTTTTQPRVKVSGMPVATAANQFKVGPGCPFQIPFGVGTKPQPCVRVQWTNFSTRVFVNNGQPVMLQPGPPPAPAPGAGTCLSVEGAPPPPLPAPQMITIQTRVLGT